MSNPVARYSIVVLEYGADHEVRLLDVDTNPERIVKGLKSKLLKVRLGIGAKPLSIRKYSRIRIVDNGSQ
jgi:hypothetical protein